MSPQLRSSALLPSATGGTLPIVSHRLYSRLPVGVEVDTDNLGRLPVPVVVAWVDEMVDRRLAEMDRHELVGQSGLLRARTVCSHTNASSEMWQCLSVDVAEHDTYLSASGEALRPLLGPLGPALVRTRLRDQGVDVDLLEELVDFLTVPEMLVQRSGVRDAMMWLSETQRVSLINAMSPEVTDYASSIRPSVIAEDETIEYLISASQIESLRPHGLDRDE